MRSVLANGVLACALELASCGKSSTGTSSSRPAASVEPAASVAARQPSAERASVEETSVRLREAGSEPRRLLRLHPRVRQRVTLRFTNEIPTFETIVSGKTLAKLPIPTERTTGVAEVVEIDARGNARCSISVMEAHVDRTPRASQKTWKEMAEGNAAIKGLTGWMTISDRGFMRDIQIAAAESLPFPAKSAAIRVRQSIRQVTVPLPKEPVGIGARWESVSSLSTELLPLLQTAVYELERIDGERIHMKVSITQAVPTGKAGNVGALETKGGGTLTLDLSRPIPTQANFDLASASEVTSSSGESGTAKIHLLMALSAL
jgi:hypothetical protein